MGKKDTTIALAKALVADMAGELHARGCDGTHPLILRAAELLPRLGTMAGQKGNSPRASEKIRPPDKLHLMTAEAVSGLNLENLEASGLPAHSREDLAEAAFLFENELLALLGDPNTMAMDAYWAMAEPELISVIRAAVDNICRLRF